MSFLELVHLFEGPIMGELWEAWMSETSSKNCFSNDMPFLTVLHILTIPEHQSTLLDKFLADQHEEELSLK